MNVIIPVLAVMLAAPMFVVETVQDAASIPEPSTAMFSGICGVFFLLWRKK
ncbi:MAG: hypothetical protein ACSHYF_04805 [Verrucomicrobiaceae bacterium]